MQKLTLKQFIENHISPNTLIRLWYKSNIPEFDHVVVDPENPVYMEHELVKSKYADNIFLYITDILTYCNYKEAINIVIESNEPDADADDSVDTDTDQDDEIIGTTGPIIDILNNNLTQEEWDAINIVNRMRLRLDMGIRFDWSNSIDIKNQITSQIVDDSVFKSKESKNLYKNI